MQPLDQGQGLEIAGIDIRGAVRGGIRGGIPRAGGFLASAVTGTPSLGGIGCAVAHSVLRILIDRRLGRVAPQDGWKRKTPR